MQEQQPINTSPYATAESFRAHLNKIQQQEAEKAAPKEEINDDKLHAEETDVPEQDDVASESKSDDNDESLSNNEETEEPKKEKESRYIPKSRLKEESEKRRVAEENLMKEREERIKFETELRLLRENNTKEKEPVYRAPDLDEVDALDTDAHQVYSRKLKDMERKLEHLTATTTQQTSALQVENIVKAQREAFEKENPDFKDALDHLTNIEFNTAKHFYPTEEAARQAVNQKFAGMVQNAVTSGKSAPELFYNIAKTYGYNGSSDEASIAKINKPKVDLDAIKRNKEKSASISNIGNNVGMGGAKSATFDITRCYRVEGNKDSGIDGDKFRAERERVAKAAQKGR